MNKENKLSAKELELISGGHETLNELRALGTLGVSDEANNIAFCKNTKPCTSTDGIACSNVPPPATKGCS